MIIVGKMFYRCCSGTVAVQSTKPVGVQLDGYGTVSPGALLSKIHPACIRTHTLVRDAPYSVS